jgi:hypothetical protein
MDSLKYSVIVVQYLVSSEDELFSFSSNEYQLKAFFSTDLLASYQKLKQNVPNSP